jgi:hypothetical protein
MSRDTRRTTAIAALLTALIAPGAGAQELSAIGGPADCAPAEPDSVQISWEAPCDSGDWLFEPGVGCRMWEWHPSPSDGATWTGQCRTSQRVGWGVVQWFEHGQPIDRFEGTFVAGKRQGAGRYTWNTDDWYVGLYDADLPNGLGTARIAGETFAGQWQTGCFRHGDKTVAIGVPRTSCERLWMRISQR